MMETEVKNYSQWLAGKFNDVSDALSRDDDRTDDELTSILRSSVPLQVPNHFEIVPLPNEISSWLTLLLQKLPVKEQLMEKHKRTKLGRGTGSDRGVIPPVSSTTTSSTILQEANESNSWEPLPWLCTGQGFQDQLMIPWLKAQSEVPYHMWHRPSGRTTGQTRQKMTTASLETFIKAI